MFFHPSTLLLIPALLFAFYAQYKVKSTYKKFQKVPNTKGMTGVEAARQLLRINGINDVKVEEVGGVLSDHYDPRDKTVRLSSGNYGSPSLAAIGVAAHEVGHAIQHNTGYAPLQWRHSLLPVTNLGSMAAFPIFMIGMLFQASGLMTLGIIAFSAVLAFHVVTLPVEFDASNRAIKQLAGHGLLGDHEAIGAKKVLNAAALTYVAAAAMAALQLIQMIIMRGDD